MEREHLNPDQIDALLDGENGPAEAAARAHLEECEVCSSEYQIARRQLGALELLPYRTPSRAFASRVMSQVRVFEPLHVTILDRAQQLIPAGRFARLALGGAAASVSLVLTALLIWVAARADAVMVIANLTLERGRVASMGFAQDAVVAIVGEPTAATLGLRGVRGIWFAIGLLAASAFVSTVGLRLVASAARRGRN